MGSGHFGSDTKDGSVQTGVPLVIKFMVPKVSGGTCVPFADALVDVWHCNAAGVYSYVSAQSTVGNTCLRGYQTTDANGLVTITTIFPGWYQGRTVHIHFKIRTGAAAASGLEFTPQLFFDDNLTDQVFAVAPYAAKGTRDTGNANDGIYGTGGDQLLLAPTGDPTNSLEATLEVGFQTS
jgi:protocatechuate 3,4-dioxygenase beta subunit